MMRTAAVVLALLTGCAGGPSPGVCTVAAELAVASRALLDSLTGEQAAAARCGLDDDEVQSWHFVPGRYAGVEIGSMTPVQVAHVNRLLRVLLSTSGFAKTLAIVELENVLRALESRPGRPATHRDPGRYALLVAGEPLPGGTFVVRFQGHHVSLRAAVVDGVLAGFTPHFLGGNPHEALLPGSGVRAPGPLAHEERLARELLAMFDDERLQRAVFAGDAPPEVLLGPGKAPGELGERRGLPWSAMTEPQRAALWRLIEYYARRLRADVADTELARIRTNDLDELSFAWAGAIEDGPGQPHYYRIHGAHFAIEYDCTQDDANHVHTVWRDFDRDFGGDPLRDHLHQHAGDLDPRGS